MLNIYSTGKVDILALKLKSLCQILALEDSHFDQFQRQKTRFVDVLIFIIVLFKSYLDIIFGFKKSIWALWEHQKLDICDPRVPYFFYLEKLL